MNILRSVAEALQQVLGESLDQLGRQTGVIRRLRKFSGSTLLKTLVLTLLKSPHATFEQYVTTASFFGVSITGRAIEKRFTPQLVEFLRRALGPIVTRGIVAAPTAVPLLGKFTAVLVGDSTTVTLPDEYADAFPGCGGKADSGKAAVKIQLIWNLCTGKLAKLLTEPGRSGDAQSAAVPYLAPAGSLSLYDLGYFELKRLARWTAAGAHWISRWQQGTITFHADGRPLELLSYLQQHTGPWPLDLPILLGASERLACRLIALRVSAEVAARRRQKAYAKAQKHGRVPTAEHLAWCDWTVFVTDCSAKLLKWKEVVVLYRARWQIELMFKLWKSHNLLAQWSVGASPVPAMAEFWAKLIGIVLQHWVLLSTAWPDERRSLWKAARVIRDHVAMLIGALNDVDRLADAIRQIGEAILAVARITTRKKHPSSFQLLLNPDLLDWQT